MKPEPEQQENGKVFHVLIIDDNEADSEITTILLGEAWPFERGLLVDYATNGEEALRKLRNSRYALILLDWKLPTMGGAEVLRAIRRDVQRIPVVVISGLQREAIPEDLASLGSAFLNKDRMNADTLNEAIATSLRLVGLLEKTASKGS